MSVLRRLAAGVRAQAAAGLVLLVCLTATIVMARQVQQTTTAKDSIRFAITVDRVQNDITRRLDTYIAMLRAGAGLLAADPDLSRDQFHAFVERIELQGRYPGIQGIGYSERIAAPALDAWLAARRQADPSLRVWPPGPRDEYHAIVFLEPLDRRNRAAIGYDMFTEPVRRAAMARARDTGLPAASGRVTLVQEIDPEKQAGFLLYVPVYEGARAPATVEERRARLKGFIYSPFRMGDLLSGIFGTEQQPRIGFELYDERPHPATLLFRSGGYDPGARFTDHVTLAIAGRPWELSLSAAPALEDASSRSLVPLMVLVGTVVSLLMAGLTGLETRARTRLEQSELALSDTSQRFQLLADSIPQLVWMARADGWVFWYNRRWYEYTGTTPEQMEGWGWQRVHDPAFLPGVLEKWTGSIAAGDPFELEFPLRRADGEMRWFLTRVVPIRNARGQLTQWFGTNTDVQGRRDTEQQLQELVERERALRAEAERVSQIKDEFLATLSHELRTPLNAIIGWNHLLLDGNLAGEAQRRALATVQRNARQQARLIDDLLDMSRIISGKIRLEMRQVDLNEIVEAAVNVVRPSAAAHHVTLECTSEGHVPRVLGDPGRLQQVFWNLLSNAVKFTPDGGHVRIAIGHTERHAQIVVSDTGVGLDPAFLPYVFDRFRQADGSFTRERGGLGLGLSIVKSLVELHGGTVEAASDGPGRGATFTVTLRALRAEEVSPPRGRATPPAAREDHLDGARVLLVEDDADARDLARVILEAAGATVVEAASADEALPHIETAEGVDLIVSDLGMPGMDGFDLIRHVRRTVTNGNARRTPAVALSAYARTEDRAHASDAGFDAYLAKPFHPDDLISCCASLLHRD